ncbi:MAG: glycoside hydrolase domain-containing protein [Promethearchaeota archaeon]
MSAATFEPRKSTSGNKTSSTGKSFRKSLAYNTGFQLGILAFFGSVLGYPKQILSSSWGLTTHWILIFILMGINAGFVVNSFFKRTRGKLTVMIGNAIAAVSFLFLANSFIRYTSDNLEPWVIQLAWFMRHEGFVVGVFLGSICFSAILNLSYLISLVGTRDVMQKQDKVRVVGKLIFTTLSCFTVFQAVYINLSMVLNIFIMFALLGIGVATSILPGIREQELELPAGKTRYIRKKWFFTARRQGNAKQGNASITRINNRLEQGGSEKLAFWWFFLFMMVSNAGVIYLFARTYPTGTVDTLFLLLIPVLSSLLVAVLAYGRRRSDELLKVHGVKRWKTSGLAWVDGLRIISVVLVVGVVIYFFPHVIYLPDVLFKTGLFALPGVIIQVFTRKNKIKSIAMYACSTGLMAMSAFLIFNDVIKNAYNFMETGDLVFPFTYLHGWIHVSTVGFASGYLLSHELTSFVVNHNDGGDSVQRAFFITALVFVIGCFVTYSGRGIVSGSIPGGSPSVWEGVDLSVEANISLAWICLAGALLSLGAGLAFTLEHLHVHFVINRAKRKPRRGRARARGNTGNRVKTGAPGGSSGNKSPPVSNAPKKKAVGSRLKRYQAISIMLIGTMGFFLGGTLSMGVNFARYQSKPLVYYKQGEFAMWVANSSERINPNAMVSLAPSNVVDNFTIHAAANEYEAFQVVWTPLGRSMNDVECEFTDFNLNVSEMIPKEAFSIRHEKTIMGGTFPEILENVSGLDLHDTNNHVFWVSIRVPYGTTPGTYTGSLKFKYDFWLERSHQNYTIKIDFNVHVWNFTIPRMRHLRTNMGPQATNQDHVNSFNSHRINSYGIPITGTTDHSSFTDPDNHYTCFLNTTNNTWTFNWTYWDQQTNASLQEGANGFMMNVPILGMPRVPPLGDTNWVERYENFLQDAQQHMIDNGWDEYAFIYFVDEFQMFHEGFEQEEYYQLMEDFLSIINKSAPLIKIMTTTPPNEDEVRFKPYIDIYCPIATDYRKDVWEERMADGYEFWMYFCIGPQAPWPNSHLYNRLFETRIMLWQAYLYGLHGFLYWSTNYQAHGNYGFGYNGWGDGWFVHFDDAGNFYEGLRWENYLDAQEDFEYLWLVNRSLAYLQANSTNYTSNELDDLQNQYTSLLSSVVGEKEVYCQHPAELYAARIELARMLDEFSKYMDIIAIAEEKWSPPPPLT